MIACQLMTYVNVDLHAIALRAAHRGRDHDQRVPRDEVPDATFLLLCLLAGVRPDVELEGIGGSDEQQQAAEALQERPWESHGRDWLSTRLVGMS